MEKIRTCGAICGIVAFIMAILGNPYHLPHWQTCSLGILAAVLVAITLWKDYIPWARRLFRRRCRLPVPAVSAKIDLSTIEGIREACLCLRICLVSDQHMKQKQPGVWALVYSLSFSSFSSQLSNLWDAVRLLGETPPPLPDLFVSTERESTHQEALGALDTLIERCDEILARRKSR